MHHNNIFMFIFTLFTHVKSNAGSWSFDNRQVQARSQSSVVFLISSCFILTTGGRARYQIGDMVRLNCTSGRSKPAAHLQWFINGEPADLLTRQFETIITGREGKPNHENYFLKIPKISSTFRLRNNDGWPRVSCSSASFQTRRYEIKGMNTSIFFQTYFNFIFLAT